MPDRRPTCTDDTHTHDLGPAARLVAVPSAGAVPRSRTTSERADRIRVYEQVLREGTEDDVRFYVDADELREVFDELVLPPPVRRAWRDWLRRHPRGA
jgi:hypothetical protein